MSDLTIRQVPCKFCPYHKDCPSGVWHENEYLKLPEYDNETFLQPFGVFLCHDGDRESEICRGWAEVHGQQCGEYALLSERLAQADLSVEPCGIPMFLSGAEAAEHGLQGIPNPSPKAKRVIRVLSRKLLDKDAG